MAPRRARQLHFGLSELGTVSTSVPTKGTTCLTSSNRSRVMFQLPCPRRARRASYLLIPPSSWFQLPCPRRARPSSRCSSSVGNSVSTTVPAEGTTVTVAASPSCFLFQLPCPRRARPPASTSGRNTSEFQLPCPRRARPDTQISECKLFKFQLPCPRRARPE